MATQLAVLQCGNCEPLKAGVHAAAFGLFALMGLYNAAAWLNRRDQHLAVNAILYSALTLWEHRHIAHHRAAIRLSETGAVRLASSDSLQATDVPTTMVA